MRTPVRFLSTVAPALLGLGLAACADPAAPFVGSWAYAAGSKASIDCGQGPFDVPFDAVIETFAMSGDELVKSDSQGCAGLAFTAAGDAASLARAGQSCAIPAAGMNPAATFAPTSYVFTLKSDGSLSQTLTASYTPQGSGACSVTAANTLTRK